MHFYLILLWHSLLGSSCHNVRKPTLAHAERPQREITSSAKAPDIMEERETFPYLCLIQIPDPQTWQLVCVRTH